MKFQLSKFPITQWVYMPKTILIIQSKREDLVLAVTHWTRMVLIPDSTAQCELIKAESIFQVRTASNNKSNTIILIHSILSEPDKIRMRDGKAYTREQLKELECPMRPKCSSKRKGFRQRSNEMCDICHKKMLHCQTGSARSRRTEKRLAERAATAKLPPPPQIVPESNLSQEEIPKAAYSLKADQIIKPESRHAWRRPCLERATLLLIGDSQIARLDTLIDNGSVQLSLPGCDILDLAVLLEFGKMKFPNFHNDARRNDIAKNWQQYCADLSEA